MALHAVISPYVLCHVAQVLVGRAGGQPCWPGRAGEPGQAMGKTRVDTGTESGACLLVSSLFALTLCRSSIFLVAYRLLYTLHYTATLHWTPVIPHIIV